MDSNTVEASFLGDNETTYLVNMHAIEGIRKLIADTEILVHPEAFTIVSIDRDEEDEARRLLRDLSAFSSVTFDMHEVSLVVKSKDWAGLKENFRTFEECGPYRLITFNIVLDLSVVGFLAVLSARLAESGISIYALSTFLRDHILVKEEDVERAEEVLNQLVRECEKV